MSITPSQASKKSPTDPASTQALADPCSLRLYISEACGFDFEPTVLSSGSNTLAAIYYRREHLATICETLGLKPPATKGDAYERIKTALGQPPTDRPFGKDDLIALASHLDIPLGTLCEPHPATHFQPLDGGLIGGKHLKALFDSCHTELYLSGKDGGRISWPYRMLPVHEVSDLYADTAGKLIIDSSISKDHITNADALDAGIRYDADAVVLADVWQDVDATVDRLLDGLDITADTDYTGELILPLQPPHDDCARKLLDAGVPADSTFALGGLKDNMSATAKINAARDVRDVVGPGAHLHGLGFGVTDRLAAMLNSEPDLLDSLDSSTHIQNAVHDTSAGDERMSIVAAQAGVKLLEDVRKLSEHTESRTTLDEFTS